MTNNGERGTTGRFEIPDMDLRYACTASWIIRGDEVFITDLTLLEIQHTGYELPADEGYDPEPVILDVRHTYQRIGLEKRLRADFEDVILQECIEHAAANAGVLS